jgi:hypothetical protein
METTGELDGGNRTQLLNAVVAGLAALFVAALTLGPPGGVSWERFLGQAAAAATLTRPAMAATGGEAARPVAPVLCFRGPRGEPVDYPTTYCS